MNTIRHERLHHAYLFTGSRGIGKTSIARIFSKAIRCENTKTVNDWLISCDACSNCAEIAAGNSVDVIEIDGASNNGVDAVREIRENAKYMPASGKRKIYIIDEVHMLTTAAFNALLKTLEEPPPHVLFLFATTEPHKIPATILGRCQRFDFRRVTVAQAQSRLQQVADAEKIQTEPGALALIAQAAEGSMRDALSHLDQVVAYSSGKVTIPAVRESIGLIEGELILGILEGVLARKPLEALSRSDQAFERGHDLRILVRALIQFLHAGILAKVEAPHSNALEISAEEWARLKTLVQLRELEELELIFQVLHHGLEGVARSPQPKAVLDVLLVKCASAEILVPAAEIAAPAPAQGVRAVVRETVAPKAPPVAVVPAPAPVTVVAPPVAARTPEPRPATQPSAPLSVVAPAPALAVAPAPSPPPAQPVIIGPKTWEGFIAHTRKTRPLLGSMLEYGTGVIATAANGECQLTIFLPEKNAHYRDQLRTKIYHEQLLVFGREFFGPTFRLAIELKDTGETLADQRERSRQENEQTARDAAHSHPIIREAQALFGGDLSPIELVEQTSTSGGGSDGTK